MPIDRPDQADDPGDAHAARHGRLARDNPNTTSSVRFGAISGDRSANSPRAESDSGLRAERNAAQRAAVDTVYRQDTIDRSHARMEKLEPEKVTASMRGIEAADAELHPGAKAGRFKAKGRFAEPADLEKGEVQAPDAGMSAAARGG